MSVHGRDTGSKPLWHADFLKIIIADLLVCISVYMLFPTLPAYMGWYAEKDMAYEWMYILCFGVGVCSLAPFCNYWLDAYRRKNVVLWALAGMVLSTSVFLFEWPEWSKRLMCFMQGASYGVFQISLGSTLLLDLSDSKRRTEAAHVYYWFARFALVLGLLAGIVVPVHYGVRFLASMSLVLLLCAGLLVLGLRVPFRAPLEPALCTLDRFWLRRGVRFFIPLFMVTLSFGLILGKYGNIEFCLFLALGFLMALSMHQVLLRNRWGTEIILGFALLVLNGFLLQFYGHVRELSLVAAVCLGCGIGFTTSRYLLSYIRICEHCERGTAQTSYMLGWDLGVISGFLLSFYLLYAFGEVNIYIVSTLVILAGMFHLLFVQQWYLRNKRK